MRKLLFAAALLCLTGCHAKKARFIEFTSDPNAAAKTVTVQCVGSSSGKCGFAFAGGDPTTALVDSGATVTIAGVEPGAMYCSGPKALPMDPCHKGPVPDKKATVR